MAIPTSAGARGASLSRKTSRTSAGPKGNEDHTVSGAARPAAGVNGVEKPAELMIRGDDLARHDCEGGAHASDAPLDETSRTADHVLTRGMHHETRLRSDAVG
jgi:hypothetical protein